MENTGQLQSEQPQGSRIALPQIDTLHCQQKELENNHNVCIVRSAIVKKTCLKMK